MNWILCTTLKSTRRSMCSLFMHECTRYKDPGQKVASHFEWCIFILSENRKSAVFDWTSGKGMNRIANEWSWVQRAFSAGVMKIRMKATEIKKNTSAVFSNRNEDSGTFPTLKCEILTQSVQIAVQIELMQLWAIDAINLCHSIWWVHNSIMIFLHVPQHPDVICFSIQVTWKFQL